MVRGHARPIAAILLRIGLICLAIDLAALAAHVLELPNKLTLDGPLWLAVQQRLYRGWGPVLAPFEVGSVAIAWILVWLHRGRARTLLLVAAVSLTLMLGTFFAVVQPVNVAFARWTAASLPADWPRHRLQWELGHAARAVLCIAGLACWLAALDRERAAPG